MPSFVLNAISLFFHGVKWWATSATNKKAYTHVPAVKEAFSSSMLYCRMVLSSYLKQVKARMRSNNCPPFWWLAFHNSLHASLHYANIGITKGTELTLSLEK